MYTEVTCAPLPGASAPAAAIYILSVCVCVCLYVGVRVPEVPLIGVCVRESDAIRARCS